VLARLAQRLSRSCWEAAPDAVSTSALRASAPIASAGSLSPLPVNAAPGSGEGVSQGVL
jgi:hypothetical protein